MAVKPKQLKKFSQEAENIINWAIDIGESTSNLYLKLYIFGLAKASLLAGRLAGSQFFKIAMLLVRLIKIAPSPGQLTKPAKPTLGGCQIRHFLCFCGNNFGFNALAIPKSFLCYSNRLLN
jgi:hypothetical protein